MVNWLAHLYLSDPDPCTRIGNLLPDVIHGNELTQVPAEFQRGIDQHRAVDRFTDAHPLFRRSVARFQPPFRRFAPIIVDVLYDHFLSSLWSTHSKDDLVSFVARFHASLDREGRTLPRRARERLGQIRDGGWLLRYADLEGLANALRRTGRRLRKPVRLDASLETVRSSYADFRADFDGFFPALREHVSGLRAV